MATIDPTFSSVSAQGTTIHLITWSGLSTADTATAFAVPSIAGIAASVQMSGTWGGATVVLQASNNGSTYATIKDLTATAISATANALFEFTNSSIYLKPVSSGGAADNVDVVLVLRGVQ